MLEDMKTPKVPKAPPATPETAPAPALEETPVPAIPASLTPTVPVFPMSDTVRQALDAKAKTQQAIDELLAVRDGINAQLVQLGHEDYMSTRYPRHGRPPGTGRPPGRPRSIPRPRSITPRPPGRITRGRIPVVPGLENKVCPKCGQRGHDRRSHRGENLAEIAAGKRKAKR